MSLQGGFVRGITQKGQLLCSRAFFWSGFIPIQRLQPLFMRCSIRVGKRSREGPKLSLHASLVPNSSFAVTC